MATTQITGGLVSVEDGLKKPEEYAPPRKVRVELNFNVEDGDDASSLIEYAADLASQQVARQLGQSTKAVEKPVTQAGEPAAETQRRTRRTKAQIEADEAAAREKAAGASTTGDAGGEQTSADFDPTAFVEDEPAAAGDGLDLSEFDVQPEAEAEVITDADLNSAVQKKNAELADPPKIRELIGSYNPDPKSVFQLRQIPAGQRREFLNKLAALKKG